MPGAAPGLPAACPALSKALSQPQEKRLAGEARGWLWGVGLASPAALAQHQPRSFCCCPTCGTQGTFCCCQLGLPCSVMDTRICSDEGEGTAGILRGLWQTLTLLTGTAGLGPAHSRSPWVLPRLARAVPGQSSVVNPDPARSNRQETSSTSSAAQPPPQLHLALGAGQDPPAPVQLRPGHSPGSHPESIAKGPLLQSTPVWQPHLPQDHSVLQWGPSSLLPSWQSCCPHTGQGWAASPHPRCSSLEMLPPNQSCKANPRAGCALPRLIPSWAPALFGGSDTSPGGTDLGLAAPARLQTQQEVVWEVTISSFLFQSRISPRGWELCQDADSWFSRAVTQEQLPPAAHPAEWLPAGTDCRHICHGDLGSTELYRAGRFQNHPGLT